MKYLSTSLVALSYASSLVGAQTAADLNARLMCWPQGVSTEVFEFQMSMAVLATPDQVRNGTDPLPGQAGAMGMYKFGFNAAADTICYVSDQLHFYQWNSSLGANILLCRTSPSSA